MNEHPQQTDRTLRDTRILTLRIWGVVGCIVIAAVIFNLMGILAPVIEFLAVGSIIAFVMSPITNWLEHHGVGRGIGSLIALIVVVLILRKVIMLAELGKKAVIWSFIATYLEVLWLVTLVHAVTNQIEAISAWITSRRLISGFLDWWNAFLAALPHIGGRTFVEFVGGIVSSMGDLVVVPVAWLAIGAAVYGAKLAGRREFETPEQVTERLNHIPSPVRRVVAHAVEPVTSPIKDTVTAIGKVASAGTIPMVLFCLVFVIAAQVKVAVAWVFRTAVGPRDPWILYSLAPYSTMLQRLFYFVLALSLLAAAVNAVVLGQRATADAAPQAEQAQEPTPSSA